MTAGSRDAAVFAANLRTLCEREASISVICRKIGINRQQFNKYLSGTHLPSDNNARIIAGYFGLAPAMLLSDPDEFRALVDGNFHHLMTTARNMAKLQGFLSGVTLNTVSYQEALVGVYDRYQFSSIYKGSILRSTFCIYENDQLLQHYYVERFPSYETPGKAEYIFKYHGLCFALDGRFFTVDFETIQRNEMTFGLYAAVKRNTKKFIYGIVGGIAATQFRQPYAAKVVLRYKGPGLITKEHLRASTVLDGNDPRIPKEVVQYLGDSADTIFAW